MSTKLVFLEPEALEGSTFDWPVTIHLPGGESAKITAQFCELSKDELEELEGSERDVNLLQRVLVGWRGIVDRDGKDLAFSERVRSPSGAR